MQDVPGPPSLLTQKGMYVNPKILTQVPQTHLVDMASLNEVVAVNLQPQNGFLLRGLIELAGTAVQLRFCTRTAVSVPCDNEHQQFQMIFPMLLWDPSSESCMFFCQNFAIFWRICLGEF